MHIGKHTLIKTRKELEHAVALLANACVEEEGRSVFESEQKTLVYKKQIKKTIEQFKEECLQGFEVLFQELSSFLTQGEFIQFEQEYRAFLAQVRSETQMKKLTLDVEQGRSIQEICCLSDFFMTSLYKAAIRLYQNNDMAKAIVSFVALSFLDSKHFLYPLFLGFSYLKEQRYNEALYAYMAAALSAPDSTPYLYMAECYIHLQDPEKARVCALEGINEERLSGHPDSVRIALFEQIAQTK